MWKCWETFKFAQTRFALNHLPQEWQDHVQFVCEQLYKHHQMAIADSLRDVRQGGELIKQHHQQEEQERFGSDVVKTFINYKKSSSSSASFSYPHNNIIIKTADFLFTIIQWWTPPLRPSTRNTMT